MGHKFLFSLSLIFSTWIFASQGLTEFNQEVETLSELIDQLGYQNDTNLYPNGQHDTREAALNLCLLVDAVDKFTRNNVSAVEEINQLRAYARNQYLDLLLKQQHDFDSGILARRMLRDPALQNILASSIGAPQPTPNNRQKAYLEYVHQTVIANPIDTITRNALLQAASEFDQANPNYRSPFLFNPHTHEIPLLSKESIENFDNPTSMVDRMRLFIEGSPYMRLSTNVPDKNFYEQQKWRSERIEQVRRYARRSAKQNARENSREDGDEASELNVENSKTTQEFVNESQSTSQQLTHAHLKALGAVDFLVAPCKDFLIPSKSGYSGFVAHIDPEKLTRVWSAATGIKESGYSFYDEIIYGGLPLPQYRKTLTHSQ